MSGDAASAVLKPAGANGYPTLDDFFEQRHFAKVTKKNIDANTFRRMFSWLEGLSHAEIVNITHKDLKNISVEIQAENVMDVLISKAGNVVIRQSIITALEEDELILAKEKLETHWKGKLTEKCVVRDGSVIVNIGDLNWNNMINMYIYLGLTMNEIDNARGVTTSNVTTTAMEVFGVWVAKCKPKIEDLMYALLKAGDLNAAEEIATGWKIPLEKIHELKKKADQD